MKNVLVFRIGSLGDSIVTLPTLFYLKKKYPDANFFLLTNRANGKINVRQIFQLYKFFAKYFFYHSKNNALFLLPKINSYKFDLIFNLAPNRNQLQKIFDFIYFKLLVGCKKYYSDTKPNRNIPEYKRLLNITNAKNNFIEYLPKIKLKKKNNIVFCCGSKKINYQWEIEKYIQIGKHINKIYPKEKIIFLGDKNDYQKSQQIINQINNGINFCGKLTIKKSIILFSKVKFYFGEDTGTMHLAGLAGCPVVAFFNYRNPSKKWLPLSKTFQIFPSKICYYKNDFCLVHQNQCVKTISYKKTIQGLDKLIVYLKKSGIL